MSKQPPISTHRRSTLIRWSDVDASGYAHFDTYIRLMEETEYSFLRHRGLSVVLKDEKGTMGFPRLSVTVTIEQPVRLEERVSIDLKLLEVDGKQICYAFEIINHTGALVATGHFRVACCRFPNHKLPYAILTPESVIQALTERNNENPFPNEIDPTCNL